MERIVIEFTPEEEADFLLSHGGAVGDGRGDATGSGTWDFTGSSSDFTSHECTGFCPTQNEVDELNESLRLEAPDVSDRWGYE
jgi:hypothetical protein